jgi:RNase P/RNase MRP subunit p30
VIAAKLGIDRIASAGEFPGTIRRLVHEPSGPAKYQYLIVSDKPDDAQRADLVVIQNFDKAKEKLKKRIRVDVGLEMQISQARSMDARAAAKWLGQLRDVYAFCRLVRCQLVISSGAKSPVEMVSGRSFDALLSECEIDPATYWKDLEKWLETRLTRRVTI